MLSRRWCMTLTHTVTANSYVHARHLHHTNGHFYTRDTLRTWMYIEIQHYVLSVTMISTNRQPSAVFSFSFLFRRSFLSFVFHHSPSSYYQFRIFFWLPRVSSTPFCTRFDAVIPRCFPLRQSPRLYPIRSFVPRLFPTKKTTSNITWTARRI